jgi:hypothetical protein
VGWSDKTVVHHMYPVCVAEEGEQPDAAGRASGSDGATTDVGGGADGAARDQLDVAEKAANQTAPRQIKPMVRRRSARLAGCSQRKRRSKTAPHHMEPAVRRRTAHPRGMYLQEKAACVVLTVVRRGLARRGRFAPTPWPKMKTKCGKETTSKGISSGPTQTSDANGPFCVERWTEFGSWSTPVRPN